MKKKKLSLKKLIFMTLCLDMGIVLKKLLGPGANVFTDLLRIPGGIGTSFSLMFILVGAVLCDVPFGVTLMCVIQSLVALCLGSVGSMGLLAPLGATCAKDMGKVMPQVMAKAKGRADGKRINMMVRELLK